MTDTYFDTKEGALQQKHLCERVSGQLYFLARKFSRWVLTDKDPEPDGWPPAIVPKYPPHPPFTGPGRAVDTSGHRCDFCGKFLHSYEGFWLAVDSHSFCNRDHAIKAE